MSIRQRFYIRIDDLAASANEGNEYAFTGASAPAFAEAFQEALRRTELFHRWRSQQEDPDAVPEALAPADPEAVVIAHGADLYTDVEATTSLTHQVLAHRLSLLAGHHWTLRDVQPA